MVPLAARSSGVGRPIVALHGFTQNAQCWGPFGEALTTFGAATFVDAPGHGGSLHDTAGLWETAELTHQVGGTGVYVGYSMGGRCALHLALSSPEAVTGLVLIGATAGLRSAAQRLARRETDELLAATLETDGLEQFIDRWLAGPLFSAMTDEQSCRSQRLTNRPAGLAASLRACGTGNQDDLWGRLYEITVPVLLLSGSQDRKFTELAEEMLPLFGGPTQHSAIDGVGHSVHLEAPEQTAAIVHTWLERL